MIRLAIVARVPAPYRIHQHLRIARELGDEVELHSAFLFDRNNLPWEQSLPAEIRPVQFGPGEEVQTTLSLSSWRAERAKMKRVLAWLDEKQIDAVFTVGYTHPGHPMLFRWCRRRGIPNFLYGDSNIHGDRARGIRRWIKRGYMRWVAGQITAVLPHSIYGKQYYESYAGVDMPMFYVPQEPDYSRIFNLTAEQRQRGQLKFGLSNDRRYLLYSGRLAGVKRIDTLIDAFARIAADRPDWDLLIVGTGPLEKSLQDRVPETLRQRVVWTGFVNESDDIAAINACASVFVLPSSYEPWALVIPEAAAAGLPIVASRVVGASGELVRDGVNGKLFTPGDVDQLTAALRDVTASDERLESYGQGSLHVLDDWRRRGDPIQGVRQALAFAGLLPAPAPMGDPSPPTPALPAWRRKSPVRQEANLP